jgi:TMEM214, C-terminal, caspase 4 activator
LQENGVAKATKPKKPSPPPRQQREETPEQKARSALKSVEVAELSSLVESGKKQFSEEPSVWLRFLATSLTSKLAPFVSNYVDVEDLSSSVLELCPGELKKMLFGIAKDLDANIRQAFYENCLSAIANDVSKGD